MATSPMNPTPFFGSKISLISKSEIRYEGILYTVDPKESTIALAQVRSFGSEDRIPDKPVPPRDETFQYIIFRASDIKDLIVDQPPSPALTDPAIIQAPSTMPAAGQSSIQQLQAGIQNVVAAASKPSSGSGSQQSAPVNTSVQNAVSDANRGKPTSAQVVTSSSTNSGSSQQTSKQAPQANKQQQQTQMPQRNNANQVNRQQPHNQQNRSQHQDGNAAGFMGNRNNFNRRTNANTRSPMNGVFNQRGGGQQFNNRGFGNRFQQRQPVGFNSYNRRQNNRNFVTRPNAKPTISLPDSDFDFEKAQDEFKQLEAKLANLKVNGDAPEATTTTEIEVLKDPCYNKEKSFFDKISCEALEREKGNVQRVDWKAERKLNRETFGVVAPMRRNNGYRPNRYSGAGGGYRNNYQNYRSRSGGRSSNQGGGNSNSANNSANAKPNGLSNASTTAVSSSTSGPSTSTSTAAAVVAAAANLVSPAKN